MMNKYIELANMLTVALPYIQYLNNKTVVIKYGGAAMLEPELREKLLQDITLLKCVGMNPIVVHGGGPEINKTLDALHIKPQFYEGLRITDDTTMEVVQMVLTGKINKDIVADLNKMGAKAVGLCGIDASVIMAHKKAPHGDVDLGKVGEIDSVNTKILDLLAQDEYIPVIAPIGVGKDGESYNINADTAASEVAVALKAEKLMFLTDIDGIYENPSDPSTLIYAITVSEINELIKRGTINGGMLPKVRGCIKALEKGVNRTHILNGTLPHPLLLEIFTDSGIGTMVTL